MHNQSDHEGCHKCDKNYLSNSNLIVHIEITHSAQISLCDLIDFSFRYRTSSYISVISPVASGLAWVSPEPDLPLPSLGIARDIKPYVPLEPVSVFSVSGRTPGTLFSFSGRTPGPPFSVSGRNARSHEVRPVPYFRTAGVRPVPLFPSAGVRPVPYFWLAGVRPISKSAWTRQPRISCKE